MQRSIRIAVCLLLSLTAGAAEPTTEPPDLRTIHERLVAPLLREAPDAARVKPLLATLRPDGSWPDIDYKNQQRSGWLTSLHLHNVLQLAQAHRAKKSSAPDDAKLKNGLMRALDYWLERDFKNPNWWHNQIGVPMTMGRIMLLLDAELSPKQRAKGLEILARAQIGMTGQNRVWVSNITATRAVLERDPALLRTAYKNIIDEIRVSEKEGLQADFSFHQHGACLYSHGYGAGFAADCARTAALLSGTQYAFPPEKIDLLSRLILDGHQWLTRGPWVDYGAVGRQIARKNQSAAYLADVAQNMLALPTGREEEFRQLAARAAQKPAPPLVGNRHFWRADTMVHHRPGWYASARMFSSRLLNTDGPHNEEGLLSHHIADGCNLIVRDGEEYRDIFPLWNWQMIPGATIEQKPKLEGKVNVKGARPFVGGVTDGACGLAAFDFARGALTARKAWVFLDDEIVCLGAGITCTSDNPVVTCVNQSHQRGKVNASPAGQTPAWLHHDNIAYVFLQPAQTQFRAGAQTGDWHRINHMYSKKEITRDVFTLTIDHGKAPKNADYAYVVAPNMALNEVRSYEESSPIEILSNQPNLQAVWQRKLKLAAAAFYEPGAITAPNGLSVTVDKSCLLLIRERNGHLELTAANPNNKPLTLGVQINRPLAGEGVTHIENKFNTHLTFPLPAAPNAGSSLTRTYRITWKGM